MLVEWQMILWLGVEAGCVKAPDASPCCDLLSKVVEAL